MDNQFFILAFDVGTTSIKAGLVDTKDFITTHKASVKSEIIYPNPGWAEQDPEKLWGKIVYLSNELVADKDVKPERVLGMVFTAHMAGVLPIAGDGTPLRNIIIWLDERASGLPSEIWGGLLHLQGYNLFKLISFLRYTGGAPSKTGKDPISKMVWIRDYEPDIFKNTYKFLDVKGYLIYKSTGVVVTSPDEAHLTWLVDARNNRAIWYVKLLNQYGLDIKLFPEIKRSIDIAGKISGDIAGELGLNPGIPVIVGAGDITTAAVGSGAIKEGEPHVYIGTSDWIASHISKRKTDLFHYIGSLLSGIPEKYLLIAEQEVAAGAIEWMMKLLNIPEHDYELVEKSVLSSPPGAKNILFFPWLYGERAPIDDPYIRGGLINFSFVHGKNEVFRSIMEGVAFNIKWAYEYFKKMVGDIGYVNIVGGGALFDSWCQIVADVLKTKVYRIKDPQDAGLRGCATIASIGLKIYRDFEEAVSKYIVDKTFSANPSNSEVYDRLFREFDKFYKKTKKIYRNLNIH